MSPCPCCGGEAAVESHATGWCGLHVIHAVRCIGCGLSTVGDYVRDVAVALWERRP